MAHHGDTAIGALPASLQQILETPLVGATGTYPEGRFGEGDAGAIQFAIGSRAGRVVLDFGTPAYWVSMCPEQARDIAHMIMAAASQACAQRDLGERR